MEVSGNVLWQRRTEKRLSDMIKAQGQVVSLIYGRRRVGKSELIKQV